MADVLEMKWYLITLRGEDAVPIAKRAIARNPELAYAYYVIGLAQDFEQALRALKKGIKCKQISPFIRNYMLWRAVDHSGDLAVARLKGGSSEKSYSEGIAFLNSALEDARAFMAGAPPDNRNMGSILNWYFLCNIAVRGPELSLELKELDVCGIRV